MIPWVLWLTKAEQMSLKEALKDIPEDYLNNNLLEIIYIAEERGDFYKK